MLPALVYEYWRGLALVTAAVAAAVVMVVVMVVVEMFVAVVVVGCSVRDLHVGPFFSTRRHPANPVSVPILPLETDTSSVVTKPRHGDTAL